MKGLNEHRVIGNLGNDPKITTTNSGKKVATFSVAVNEKWRDAQGAVKESTEWINIVCWEGLAEIVEKYCKKGSAVFVGGKQRTRSWEKEDGSKGYITETIANNLILIGGNGSKPPAPGDDDRYQGATAAEERAAADPTEITDDDIPF